MAVQTKARPRAKNTAVAAPELSRDLPLGQILDGDCIEAMRSLPYA